MCLEFLWILSSLFVVEDLRRAPAQTSCLADNQKKRASLSWWMAGLIAFLSCDKCTPRVTAVGLLLCRGAEESGNEGGECNATASGGASRSWEVLMVVAHSAGLCQQTRIRCSSLSKNKVFPRAGFRLYCRAWMLFRDQQVSPLKACQNPPPHPRSKCDCGA